MSDACRSFLATSSQYFVEMRRISQSCIPSWIRWISPTRPSWMLCACSSRHSVSPERHRRLIGSWRSLRRDTSKAIPKRPSLVLVRMSQYSRELAFTSTIIAEAAYVLSYSIILLNTDAHNPQVKKHMTKEDFFKNNRKINDGGDFPEEFMSVIYDDITTNEIRMKDEIDTTSAIQPQGPGIASAIANVGRDLQKEAYVMQSLGIANKTEVCLFIRCPYS